MGNGVMAIGPQLPRPSSTLPVIGQGMARHRHQEFIRFLNRIEAAVPAGKLVYAILDNCAAHKHPKVRAWLARDPAGPFISPRPRALGPTPSEASSPH